MTTKLFGEVKKGWGHENIFVSNEHYCGKFLVFEKGKSFSMHFHVTKHETWLVTNGSFKLETLDTRTAKLHTVFLNEGDVHTVYPLVPHRLTALEESSTILEISTPDSVEDNYRVFPGASQNA